MLRRLTEGQRQVINFFIKAALSGYLESGNSPGLLPVSQNFWTRVWRAANSALAAMPPVGGADGASPDTPAGRIMEAFGSTKFPEPLLATAAGINAVKGRIMGLNAPFTIGKIEELAAAAVKDNSDEAVNNLLTAIRNVSFGLYYWECDRIEWLMAN